MDRQVLYGGYRGICALTISMFSPEPSAQTPMNVNSHVEAINPAPGKLTQEPVEGNPPTSNLPSRV